MTKAAAVNDSYEAAGRTFPFAHRYFEALSGARPLEGVVSLPVYTGDALDAHAQKTEDITFIQFLGKFYEAALVLDALQRVGRRSEFRAGLDIGSGPALQPRIMKLVGRVDQVEAIDIYDGSRRCSDALLRRYARRLRALYLLYRLQKPIPNTLRRRFSLLRRIDAKLPLGVEEFGYYPDESPYGTRLRRGPTLAAYHVGEVFAHQGRYDLVTSFMALEYFEFDKIAAKVAELLEPDGYFGFLVSYWWYPVNSTLLYGRFPYLLQQLGTEEVMDYYATVHPPLPQHHLSRRLGYSDPCRPTVADYERAAFRHGLVPVWTLRLHPDHTANSRAVVGPLAIDTLPGWTLERVLENAHRVKRELTLSDLMTSHVLMLFRKR
jgi:SAM-dependent methyltransferase